MAFTKGPWRVGESVSGKIKIYSEPLGWEKGKVAQPLSDRMAERADNARLIASAPELVEALQELMAHGAGAIGQPWAWPEFVKLRALLVHITGEDH